MFIQFFLLYSVKWQINRVLGVGIGVGRSGSRGFVVRSLRIVNSCSVQIFLSISWSEKRTEFAVQTVFGLTQVRVGWVVRREWFEKRIVRPSFVTLGFTTKPWHEHIMVGFKKKRRKKRKIVAYWNRIVKNGPWNIYLYTRYDFFSFLTSFQYRHYQNFTTKHMTSLHVLILSI